MRQRDDVLFTKTELAFRDEAEELVSRMVAPLSAQIDRQDRVPEEVFRALHPYLLLTAPRDVGGGGQPEVHACLLVEQLGRHCPALVPYIEVGQLFAKAIDIAGSPEQRRRLLGRIAEGELGAYALTDRGPGSDPVAMETEAEPSDGGFRLTGGKRHITFFERASMAVVFARTKGESGSKALGAYVLDKPFEGVEVLRRSEWTGLRGHTAWDLRLHGAPARERLGEAGGGLGIALSVLNHTRISLAFGHVGLAQSAMDFAVAFARERRIAGKPLWQHQAIGFALVDVQARIDGARLLALRAARLADGGAPDRAATSMAKLAAADALIEAVTACNRALGGAGGHLDTPAERHLRDAFSWVAAQGTGEVQRLTVARELFGG